jgi:AcrR family transcriptional regulator
VSITESRGDQDEMRQRIIDVAFELIAEKGAEGVTARELAKRAKTSTMSIYSRFGGMPGLFAAVSHAAILILNDYVTRAHSTEGPLDLVRQVTRAYRRFALDHPAAFRLVTSAIGHGEGRSFISAIREEAAYRFHLKAIEACEEAGLLKPGTDCRMLADHVWAGSHGMIAFEISGAFDDYDDLDARFVGMVDGIMAGALADGAA